VWLTRYGVVPSMLLALVLPVAAAVAHRHRGRRPALNWSIVAATTVSAVLIVAQFGPQWTRRSDGPDWRPQVAAAAASCRTDEAHSITLKETIGWTVRVPCADLRAS
jgi:hypothetical protein